MDKYFYLQDRFKKPTNMKTYSSSLKYEAINLHTEQNPPNINLGTNWSPTQREYFIKLFKAHKDVFMWTYDDLKTYGTKIIQHIIPLKEDAKPFQHKLW